MDTQYLAELRREYLRDILNPDDLPNSPIAAFKQWFDLALETCPADANAMVLSTVGAANRPSSRVVLMKDLTEDGLVFYTNYTSKKGMELSGNPYASVNFFWPQLERQIRVEGRVEKVSEETSIAYFNSRPKLSKAGAIVSNQSEIILTRDLLDKAIGEIMLLPEEELKKPDNWGGYLLITDYFEFWQGRAGRIHDRIAYTLQNDLWTKARLSP